jgi:uncharacterized membrane protein YphA (DoxX/SURF4 family)
LIVCGRVALGSFFVYAALAKLHFNGTWHMRDYHFFFAMAIDSYKMLPMSAVQWMARILPWLELTLGVLLITGVRLRWIGPITTVLLLVFMAALVHAFILRLTIVCGCTGDDETVGQALIRDIGLLTLTLIVTVDSFLGKKSQETVSS